MKVRNEANCGSFATGCKCLVAALPAAEEEEAEAGLNGRSVTHRRASRAIARGSEMPSPLEVGQATKILIFRSDQQKFFTEQTLFNESTVEFCDDRDKHATQVEPDVQATS